MPAERKRVVAVTGATGFIGRRLIPQLVAAGWQPRLLLRRDPADTLWGELRLEVVQGDLGDRASLDRLLDGADAVLHLAGLIKAPSAQAYLVANRDGTRRLAEALVQHSATAPMLLVSSLAARHPELSDYAASKRAGEEVARELLGQRLTVLRPPAVYGPGDRETLIFFQLVSSGVVPMLGDPRSRMAVIHVEDLCRALIGLLDQAPTGGVHAVADARPQGYDWNEILSAAAQAQGIAIRRRLQVPRWLLRTVALVGDAGRRIGRSNMLNSEKLNEILHLDWSVTEAELPPLPGWSASFDLTAGFADAVRYYRTVGWLNSIHKVT